MKRKTECAACLKYSVLIFVEKKYIKCNIWGVAVCPSNTGCPRRNVPDFGRVFLMLKYTDITQNTYVQI